MKGKWLFAVCSAIVLQACTTSAIAAHLDGRFACDNWGEVHINGEVFPSSSYWGDVTTISDDLNTGWSIISAKVWNSDGSETPIGPAMLIARFEIDGLPIIVTDTTWLWTQQVSDGWDLVGYDDSSWGYAEDYGPADTSFWNTEQALTDTFGPCGARYIWRPDCGQWYQNGAIHGDAPAGDTVYFRCAVFVCEPGAIIGLMCGIGSIGCLKLTTRRTRKSLL